MWFLVWWPHAITQTGSTLSSPTCSGLPAASTSPGPPSLPLAGLLAAPITDHYGPIVAYNLLCLLCPALAAWTAFLLCRRLTARFWPSLVGGYIFGFSAYMLAEIHAHLLLILIFPVPLTVLLVLRRLADEIRTAAFDCADGPDARRLLHALARNVRDRHVFRGDRARSRSRARGQRIATTHLCADHATAAELSDRPGPRVAVSVLLLSTGLPALTRQFARRLLRGPPQFHRPHTTANARSAHSRCSRACVSRRFAGASVETGACVGLPLIVIAILFIRAHRTEVAARLPGWFALVAALAALGPRLHLGGLEFFGLPWKLLMHLPLLDNALPGRFPLYVFLALAVLAAQWLADDAVGRGARLVGLAALAVAFAPNPSAIFWITPVDLARVFRRRQLSPISDARRDRRDSSLRRGWSEHALASAVCDVLSHGRRMDQHHAARISSSGRSSTR